MERGVLSRYADSIQVKAYPSGERRIAKLPPKELIVTAFGELGTEAAVASAFGVARQTVKHWAKVYGIQIVSHPEAGLASLMRRQLTRDTDKCKVSQWLMDEGSVSVAYHKLPDHTILLVCGSMNDYEVLTTISAIMNSPITSSKPPGPTSLPMGAVRVVSARAYALLETIYPYLVGLKAKEAEAALRFFPSSGIVRGRHTTDEFLLPVWEDFSLDVLHQWNQRRRVKISKQEILEGAKRWVDARVRRARRFLDANIPSNEGTRPSSS